MTKDLCTGGDIRGQIIAKKFKKNKSFKVQMVTPEISLPSFKGFKNIIIGHQHFEKKINRQTLFSAFILYFTRTIELIYQKSKIKTDILYSTGDFFCNIIPCFIIKLTNPNTKFIVCVHHVNDNPFKRKSNSLVANIISFFVQRFSFFLIKHKSDLIFVVNNHVKQYFIHRGYKQPIIITGNGLDINIIESQINSLNIKPTNHISYFGRLSPTKGSLDLPIILSNVLNKHPDTHLDLVGIALPEIIKPLIQKFNEYNCQGKYTIHNFIKDKRQVFKILLKSKVIVFPSYEEGWGISLFESIMTKRPVVAYELPIFKEIFKNKLMTVPIGDTQIMSDKTIDLIDNYSSEFTKKNVHDCYLIAKKYDWENVYKQEKKSIMNLLKNETSKS